MRFVPILLCLAAACALSPALPVLAQDAPPVQGVAPKTVAEHQAEARQRAAERRAQARKRAEEAKAEARKQAEEEDRMAREASEEDNRRWEELRAQNAERIRQFDEAVEDWVEQAPKPPGTRESFIHLTYDNDTALGEGGDVTYFNRHNIPTHRVTFGPDGKPTSDLTLTQQGRVWETIGPQLEAGGAPAVSYGRAPDGEEIITMVQVVRNKRVVAEYHFNAEGLPWMGERFDADETRIGGFYDPRFEPPPVTVGGPLTVPASFRPITGVCPQCRDKAERYNDLVNQANSILNQMRDQSLQHQSALPPAQGPIKARHRKLADDLAALTPQIEAARAAMMECEKICRPRADDTTAAAGPPTSSTTSRLPPPDLTRPSLLPVAALEVPASFCDEFERVAYMNEVYTPNAKASLANAQTANAHVGKLNGLFTEYMRGEGGPGWAAVREEQAAYGPIAAAALADSTAINALYQRILAVPLVPCPGKTQTAQGPSSGAPPASDPGPETPPLTPGGSEQPVVLAARSPGPTPPAGKKPCPPKPGRKPIVVGANSKVGSGAQLQKKLGGMLVGGLLGAAGVGGGGGGGGPTLYKCRIKNSEQTLFTHPSGLSIKVGAKRGKGDVVNIFTEIAKSPDKGTFQAAFLEKPDGGQVQAPFDAGPCDLWGEWELTVSWTKTTYVNGQMVSQESGGWSEGGKFNIPGTLSKVDAPEGMWKQMGFSSASHGAREAFMAFRLPQGGGPHTFVVHITQPKGDPVTTVPFVLTMVETAPGVFNFTQLKTEEDCPPVPVDRVLIADDGAPSGPRPPLAPPSAPPATPAAPPSTPTVAKPRTGFETSDLTALEEFIDAERAWALERLERLKTADACDKSLFDETLDGLSEWYSKLRLITGEGPMADAINQAVKAELPQVEARWEEVQDLWENRCKPPGEPPKPEDPPESILDEIDEVFVPA